jgi:arylsulfatase A-like enzyme
VHILILTSDNGMPYGAQRLLHDKKVPYGTQIPFYIHWPRVLGTRAQSVGDIQNIDLAPTLCDIAGCRLGPTHRPGHGLTDARSSDCSRASATRSCVRGLTSYQEPGKRVSTYGA